MPKTKVSADQKIKLPKSILNKYRLKDGDILMIRIVSGSIILTPEKLKMGKKLQKRRNSHSKNRTQRARVSVRETDEERNDWLRLSLQGLESAYSDNEPEYTSDMIIERNPDYERR